MWEIVSVITAVEESDGWDSSVVQRPIVIMSMNDTIGAASVHRPMKWQGLERKSVTAMNRTQSLWFEPPVLCHWSTMPNSTHPPFLPLLALLEAIVEWYRVIAVCVVDGLKGKVAPLPLPFQRSTDGGNPDCVAHWHDHYQSWDHRGVPSIGLLHSCDYAYDFSHQLTHTAITLYLSTYTITMAMQNCWIQELGYNCNKRPTLVYSYNRLNTRPRLLLLLHNF